MASNGVDLFDFQIINSYEPPRTDANALKARGAIRSQPPAVDAFSVDISPEARELKKRHDSDQHEVKQEYLKEKKSLENDHSKKQKQALAEYRRIQGEISADYERNRMKLRNSGTSV
jgi:hypothetical protein